MSSTAGQGPAPAKFSNNNSPSTAPQYLPPTYPPSQFAPSYPYPPYGMPPPVSYNPPFAMYGEPQRQMTPPQPKSSLKQMLKQFVLNQQVEVCLRGNMWVLGIVVGALKLWDKITGGAMGYDVRYTVSGETRTDTFPVNAVRLPQYQL